MWKTFQHDEELYMIKSTQNNEDIVIYLTDLKDVWSQCFSFEAVLEQFQQDNPMLVIKIEEASCQLIDLIDNISSLDTDMSKSPDQFQVVLKSTESNFDLQFKLEMTKASADVFLKEVTVPLIQTVKYLEENQNILSNLIQRKDRELEEYKLEKGNISRGDLITEKFNEESLNTIIDKSMLNVFGISKEFWDTFMQKHGDLKPTIENVRKDPWNHMKRKRKVYSSKASIKKGAGVNFNKNE